MANDGLDSGCRKFLEIGDKFVSRKKQLKEKYLADDPYWRNIWFPPMLYHPMYHALICLLNYKYGNKELHTKAHQIQVNKLVLFIKIGIEKYPNVASLVREMKILTRLHGEKKKKKIDNNSSNSGNGKEEKEDENDGDGDDDDDGDGDGDDDDGDGDGDDDDGDGDGDEAEDGNE